MRILRINPDQAARGAKRAEASGEHVLLIRRQLFAHARVVHELVAQGLFDQLVHPAFHLLMAEAGELPGAGEPGVMFEHGIPDFGDAFARARRAGDHARRPARAGGGEQVQHVLVLAAGGFGFRAIVAVGFVEGDQVGHLDDAALHALQFVARARQHQQQEEIDHGADGGFRLAHAHGFDQHVAISGRFAQQHGFAGAAGDAAQRSAGGRWPDERALVVGQRFHARLVAQDAAARHLAGRVHGQHRDFLRALAGEIHAQHFDEGALAHAGHAGDAHANGIAGVGQALLQHVLRQLDILGVQAFDQGDGAAEDGAVAAQHALDVLVAREAPASHFALPGGLRCRRRLRACPT